MVRFEDLYWLAETVYLYLPAYLANAAPVIFGGGKPIDGGRLWIDDRPLLGDHKTIRGAIAGLAAGLLIGTLQMRPVAGGLMSIGTIGGDILTSFVKRRIDLRPGASFPVADQIGFIVFSVALVSLVEPTPWDRVIAIIVMTLPIHFLTNVFAWLFKLKSDPW
jgi:CDP-2,3-bis-(O-geranylgeranyl)-sn-glycerol synthase